MNSLVSFHDSGAYTLCRYTGPFELNSLVDVAREVNEYCVRTEHYSVMVDIRESVGEIGAGERYELGTRMAELWNRKIRLAVIMRSDQIYSDHFWETVVNNRGIGARIFMEIDDATRWLEGGV